MSKAICSVGDIATGTCTDSSHPIPVAWTGAVVTGAPAFTVQGRPIARVGDTGTTSCGHTFQIAAGSPLLSIEGVPVARMGDPVIVLQGGTGVMASGAAGFEDGS